MQSQLGRILGIEFWSSCMLGKNTITELHPHSPVEDGQWVKLNVMQLWLGSQELCTIHRRPSSNMDFPCLLWPSKALHSGWHKAILYNEDLALLQIRFPHLPAQQSASQFLRKISAWGAWHRGKCGVLGEEAGTGDQFEALNPVPWGSQAQFSSEYIVHCLFRKEVKPQLTHISLCMGFCFSESLHFSPLTELRLTCSSTVWWRHRLRVVKKSSTARDLFQRWWLDFDVPVSVPPAQTVFRPPLSVQGKSMKTCNTPNKTKQRKTVKIP